jgi:hypothetical protein
MTGPELVTSTIAIFAAAAFILNKFGFLQLGKHEKRLQMEPCALHNSVDTLIKGMKEIQTQNVDKHKNHEAALKKGESDFHEIRLDIVDLKVGVGILLDRTGGRPDEYGRKSK